MRVRMLVGISGGRGDGTPWPGAGGELEVDDEEGAALCAARLAVPVAQKPPEEKAVPPAAEERAGAPKAAARPRAAKPG